MYSILKYYALQSQSTVYFLVKNLQTQLNGNSTFYTHFIMADYSVLFDGDGCGCGDDCAPSTEEAAPEGEAPTEGATE
jgi:hypothetical protein